MEQFVWETAEELDQKLAQRVRNIRKRRSISQEKLSSMSGVSYGDVYKRQGSKTSVQCLCRSGTVSAYSDGVF